MQVRPVFADSITITPMICYCPTLAGGSIDLSSCIHILEATEKFNSLKFYPSKISSHPVLHVVNAYCIVNISTGIFIFLGISYDMHSVVAHACALFMGSVLV